MRARETLERWFGTPSPTSPGYLWPRWIWLRALGLIFFSAFYSLALQIHGLVGERGILPAGEYLDLLRRSAPGLRALWVAPGVFWLGAGDVALRAGVLAGLGASFLLVANVWPRVAAAACTLLFLSFVSVLQDFSSYQSDGMLLEAGLVSTFFAPRGALPGLGAADPPSRASLFLLRWEWFRIYFESGVVKLASGDPQWRSLTAMDHYYENGPLPTWVGWYAEQLPHAFHAATALATLALELGVAWLMFLPRRFRIACFLIVTPFQLGIILTANYAFLNYQVLALGVLLLDDRALARVGLPLPEGAPRAAAPWRVWASAFVLTWIFYATVVSFPLVGLHVPRAVQLPAVALEPFRVANAYGLFAVMTTARYEIEFQGTRDGLTWVAYPFRYKPQDPAERPGIYAPYQPRFEWNLWFASLEPWRANPWVVLAQLRLLENSPAVLTLFRRSPFADGPPSAVRTVLWQYWFTDRATLRATGRWWNRRQLGLFSGQVERRDDGRVVLIGAP